MAAKTHELLIETDHDGIPFSGIKTKSTVKNSNKSTDKFFMATFLKFRTSHGPGGIPKKKPDVCPCCLNHSIDLDFYPLGNTGDYFGLRCKVCGKRYCFEVVYLDVVCDKNAS